ncbi:hypothetical protein [Roseibium sp.]|uniref:hypothetical protein n=1 Tax=Roseibium sp. TaxID=1936156 RepID=UPI003D140A02
MKSLIFLMVAAALFAGGLFYVASDKTLPPPTAEELAALIKMEDPSIEGAAVSIDKCRLSIKNELPAGDDEIGGMLYTVHVSVDLRKFNFETVNLVPVGDGRMLIRSKWNDKQPGLMDLAEELLEMSQGPDRDSWANQQVPADPESIRRFVQGLFSLPGSTLSLNLRQYIVTGADGKKQKPEPHEDADAFQAFAAKALKIPHPSSLQVSLTYIGDTPQPDRLFSGSVFIPTMVDFISRSKSSAENLGERLYAYTLANCSR